MDMKALSNIAHMKRLFLLKRLGISPKYAGNSGSARKLIMIGKEMLRLLIFNCALKSQNSGFPKKLKIKSSVF